MNNSKFKIQLKFILIIEILVVIFTVIIGFIIGRKTLALMSDSFFYVALVQLIIGFMIGLGTNKTTRFFVNLFRPNYSAISKSVKNDPKSSNDAKLAIHILTMSGAITLLISIILGLLV